MAGVQKGHIMAKHLTLSEREMILDGIEKKKSLSKIAKELNRSTTTISTEIKQRCIF